MRLALSFRVLTTLVGLTSLGMVAMSVGIQQPPDSRNPLFAVLRKVSAAAEERPPFASLGSDAASGTTSTVLPNADTCTISRDPTRALLAYQCIWRLPDALQARKTYEQFEEEILQSGDWLARPYRDDQSLRFTSYDASTGARVHLTVSFNRANTVTLVIAPGKTQALSSDAAPSKENKAQTGKQTLKEPSTSDQQMSMGMFAASSDREGILFVDGERKQVISVGKVVSLRLAAGQHFVDLRDSKGKILWEKIISVPTGAQVVEQIRAGSRSDGVESARTTTAGSISSSSAKGLEIPQYAPGVQSTAATNSIDYSQPVSLDGDWACEAGVECQIASVSATGSRFSARLESNPHMKGQPCDGMKFPPAPSPAAGGCYIVFEFVGVLDGSSIQGVVSMITPPADSLGCALPSERHNFTGTFKENGRVIAINTEVNETIYHYHDARTWAWQKPHFACDPATIDHTSPVMILLRSKASSGSPSGGSSGPRFSAPAGNIASQIDEIVKSGRYTTLPLAQTTSNGVAGQPIISIENRTSYELIVMVAGPIEKSITVSAGASQTVTLPDGNYRVVGRVNAPNVLPFFGTQSYASGTSYRESFYIQ